MSTELSLNFANDLKDRRHTQFRTEYVAIYQSEHGIYEHWGFFIPSEQLERSWSCPSLYVAMYQCEYMLALGSSTNYSLPTESA